MTIIDVQSYSNSSGVAREVHEGSFAPIPYITAPFKSSVLSALLTTKSQPAMHAKQYTSLLALCTHLYSHDNLNHANYPDMPLSKIITNLVTDSDCVVNRACWLAVS